MTEKELRLKLDICTKHELIDMIVIQWHGLGEIEEQITQ